VLLPARLGELARVIVLDRHSRVGRSMALTTVGITQLFDMLFLVGYCFIISIWTTNQFNVPYVPVGMLGTVIVLSLCILVILKKKHQLLSTSYHTVRRKLPKFIVRRIISYSNLFLQGLDILGKARKMFYVIVLTLFVWSLETIAMHLMLQAFHINSTLLISAILVIVLSLSYVFPIVPGNIGIHQAVSIFLLGTFGTTAESALAFSVGAQSSTYIIIVSIGILCLYREKINLQFIINAAERNDYER